MTKLIKNWQQLSKLKNDKYKVLVNDCCGWIVPLCDEPSDDSAFDCHCPNNVKSNEKFWKHHIYLSTHTFYGSQYKYSTKIFQEHGFDIEIDNWDKVGE